MAPLSITYDAVLPAGSTITDVAAAIRAAVVGNYSLTLDSDTTDTNYACYFGSRYEFFNHKLLVLRRLLEILANRLQCFVLRE